MISIFKKVENEDINQQFRIHIQFNKDNFTLVVLEKAIAWKAEVSWCDITKLSGQFDVNADEYYSTLKQYVEDTSDNVDLKLRNNEFVCYYRENNIKLKYFSCKLQQIGFNEYIYDLLDEFSLENKKLKQQNIDIKKEAEKLREGSSLLEEKLTQLVERKAKEEQELLSNFVLVLNEKKRRIQHLNQTLHAFKAGRPVLNPPVQLKKNPKKEIKKECSKVSDSSSDADTEEYNTDDEKLKKNEESPMVLPSTSKKRDDDLFLDDSDDLIDLPKRRKVKDEQEEVPSMSSTPKIKNKHKEPEVAGDAGVEENSPTIMFNTQDLLDCI